jgi:hypothetical protein
LDGSFEKLARYATLSIHAGYVAVARWTSKYDFAPAPSQRGAERRSLARSPRMAHPGVGYQPEHLLEGVNMSDTVAAILVIVAVVLVIAVVAALLLRTRGRERRARQAEELRTHASAQSTDVQLAQREAASREAAAEQAREQAEIAEARAAEARQALAQTEARREDTVREADRLDPSVDHRDAAYQPDEPPAPGRHVERS